MKAIDGIFCGTIYYAEGGFNLENCSFSQKQKFGGHFAQCHTKIYLGQKRFWGL